jgi:alkanesulfonate monooxygenase SsuD/methylene tetrahydromethanopterin reductase-like flavin-dependent oxidoreductase (luciferase family)
MRIFGFHLMPYPHVPDEALGDTSWVTISNALYDPELGHALYGRYLDEFELYDRTGFDGISVNEHHQTIYGQIPSPNVMAALLVQRVKGKIALLGNAIALREQPLRVAEEVALLDVVSGGRIICGFVRGIGAEYHSFSIDPTSSRERFFEAHDLIIKAWTEPGPWEWYGKHYKLRYVNPWPQPYQQPHPPIWSPSQGSNETVEWAASNRYTYLHTYSDIPTVRRVFGEFRAACERNGYEASREQLGWAMPIFVADSDEEARRIAAPQLETLFNRLIRMPRDVFFPAGYTTLDGMARVMAGKSGLGTSVQRFDEMAEKGYFIVGSADTVRQRLEALHAEMGFGTLMGSFQFGYLGHEDFASSVQLFADKVLPALRPLGEPLASTAAA